MISKFTASLRFYCLTIASGHFLLFAYFYPVQLIYIIFVPATFYILYKWVELTYQIEQSNRDNLIALINSSEHEATRQLLLQELWQHDLHSLGDNPTHEYRI